MPEVIRVPMGTRLAVFGLLILVVIVGGGNLWATYNAVNSFKNEQRAQGQVIGSRICRTFGGLAAIKPPAGDPRTNPSRAFEQRLHARLDELGRDIGCKTAGDP